MKVDRIKSIVQHGYFCSCGDPTHVMRFSAFSDEPEGYVEVYSDRSPNAYNFKDRIKLAWKVLMKSDHTWNCIALDPETIDEFIDDLQYVSYKWKLDKTQ